MNERTRTIALLAHSYCYVATCCYRRANGLNFTHTSTGTTSSIPNPNIEPNGNGASQNSRFIMRFIKKKLCVFNQTLGRTRESYFSEIIKNCSNNSRVLFATVNRLTNPPVSLRLELISTSKCKEFAILYTVECLCRNPSVSSPIAASSHITVAMC